MYSFTEYNNTESSTLKIKISQIYEIRIQGFTYFLAIKEIFSIKNLQIR